MKTVKFGLIVLLLVAATRVFALESKLTELAISYKAQVTDDSRIAAIMPNTTFAFNSAKVDVMTPILLTYAVASFYIAQEHSPNTHAVSEINMFGAVMVASAFYMMLL